MTERQTEEQEQLVNQIEETRAELGETVDALAQKADVKARLSEELGQRKAAWRDRVSSATLPKSSVSIHLATARQVIELGPVFVFNFGKGYPTNQLKGCDG